MTLRTIGNGEIQVDLPGNITVAPQIENFRCYLTERADGRTVFTYERHFPGNPIHHIYRPTPLGGYH